MALNASPNCWNTDMDSLRPSRLRPMETRDLQQVLGWRNHPDVRAVSTTQDPIDFDAHQR